MTHMRESPNKGPGAGIALDDLFQANAAARPDAIALIDPPNRANFTDGAPLRLSYTEMNERVERLAHRLVSFGMPARSVVAVQLPNVAEAIISLLAILRAGMVAAPVPSLWRRSELVAALSGVSPKALITLSCLDGERPAEIACESAAELFDLSFPCAFGVDIPDGVVALDRDVAFAETLSSPSRHVDEKAISLVTFDTDADGFFAAGRSDAQWLAAGLAAFLESKVEASDTIVTTLPPNSLAGISTAFVPWLLSGGTLELIHGHVPEAVAGAAASGRAHLVVPAAVLPEITRRMSASASCIAVHRGPPRQYRDVSPVPRERLVDFYCFGETAVVALARDDSGHVWPIPVGGISAPSAAIGAPILIEVRMAEGQVWLRAPMIPDHPFPDANGPKRPNQDRDGFACTGFRCHGDGNGGLIVDAGPERVVSMGGLRFGLNDLQSRFSACGEIIKVTAIDDRLLGQRLHIEAADADAAVAALQAAGHSRLVIEAVEAAERQPTI